MQNCLHKIKKNTHKNLALSSIQKELYLFKVGKSF